MEGFPKLMAVFVVPPDPSFVIPWGQFPKNKINLPGPPLPTHISHPVSWSAGAFTAGLASA